MNNNDVVLGIVMVNPPLDSIQRDQHRDQQLRARVHPGRRRGRAGGDEIGHQRLHGSAFEFLQNNVLNAQSVQPGACTSRARRSPPTAVYRRSAGTSLAGRWAARRSRTSCSGSATTREHGGAFRRLRDCCVCPLRPSGGRPQRPRGADLRSHHRQPERHAAERRFAGDVIPPGRFRPRREPDGGAPVAQPVARPTRPIQTLP